MPPLGRPPLLLSGVSPRSVVPTVPELSAAVSGDAIVHRSGHRPSKNSDLPWAKRIRIMEAVKKTRRVETERTVASLLLGKNTSAEAFLFRILVKSRKSTGLIWLLWWTGLVTGLLALAQTLPEPFIWGAMFMLPLPCLSLLVLSTDLVQAVLGEFQCYLITGLEVTLFLTAVRLLGDRRIVFWVSCLPSMFVATLMDAYPSKYRPVFCRMFFLGVGIVLASWNLMLCKGWCEPVHDSVWHVGQLQGRLASNGLSVSVTLLFFCIRHYYVAFFKQDEFVLIVSTVRTTHVDVKPEPSDGGKCSYRRVTRVPTSLSMDDDSIASMESRRMARMESGSLSDEAGSTSPRSAGSGGPLSLTPDPQRQLSMTKTPSRIRREEHYYRRSSTPSVPEEPTDPGRLAVEEGFAGQDSAPEEEGLADQEGPPPREGLADKEGAPLRGDLADEERLSEQQCLSKGSSAKPGSLPEQEAHVEHRASSDRGAG